MEQVTCGYCGALCHNKRGCPQLKADIERRRSMFGEDDWKVEHENRQRTSRKGEKRSCTYCEESHRRTCVTLSTTLARWCPNVGVSLSLLLRRVASARCWSRPTGVSETRYVVTGIDRGLATSRMVGFCSR